MAVTIEWMTNETTTAPEGGDTVEATFGTLDLDAVIVETYDLAAEATEHPVEQGVNITDHVRPALALVTLEVTISNTPIRSTLDHAAQLQNVELRLPSITRIRKGAIGIARRRSTTEESSQRQGVRVLQFGEEFDRCREVFDQLVELKDSGTPIDVIGARYGDLENYLIIGLSTSVENDNTMSFIMDVRELRTARTETVEAPSPRVERGRTRQDSGSQPTKEPNSRETTVLAASTDRLASILRGGG